MRSKWFTFIFAMIGFIQLSAQELLQEVEKEYQDTLIYAQATFKGTRIGFSHSVETRQKKVLEISAITRFWDTPAESSQSFFADRMSTRIGLEYAISDRFTSGLGGTTWDGIFDVFVKYRLMRQAQNGNGPVVHITLFQNASYRSEGSDPVSATDTFGDRMAFTSQILIARKFTPKLSLQLSPSYIHRNSAIDPEDPRNQFALGFGGRYKLGNHVSIISEYFYVFNPLESIETYGPFSIGINWEVSDLILQFQLTNARNMVEDAFITGTRNNFNFRDPNLHFGFSAVYVLHFNKK